MKLLTTVSLDSFHVKYMLNIKGQCSHRVDIGKDALGNMQRISNALARIPDALEEARQKLENVQRQLAIAKEEVEKPFVKEAELSEKLERLAELNALLNMDEKGPAEAAILEEAGQEAGDMPESDTGDIVGSEEVGREQPVMEPLLESEKEDKGTFPKNFLGTFPENFPGDFSGNLSEIFPDTAGDCYAVCQVVEGGAGESYRGMCMDYVGMKKARVSIEDYKAVYRGSLTEKDTLDELQRDYGWEHPESFMGNPVSISDVVIVRKDGEVNSYYVDIYSFVKISGFVGYRDMEMDLNGNSVGAVCEAEVKYSAAREETGPGKRKSVLEALKEKQSKQRGQEDRADKQKIYRGKEQEL